MTPYYQDDVVTIYHADSRGKAIGIELEERYCEMAARRCAQEVLDIELASGVVLPTGLRHEDAA